MRGESNEYSNELTTHDAKMRREARSSMRPARVLVYKVTRGGKWRRVVAGVTGDSATKGDVPQAALKWIRKK